MFREVVAAIDGSPASFRAAALGAQIAATEGGGISLVAVAQPRSELSARLHLGAGGAAAERERRAADLRSAEVVVGKVAPVRSAQVLEGPVVETLLAQCPQACREDKLFCVGSGKHRVRLGSTSSALLRNADCAVLVVREGTSRSPRVQRILVGYDGTPGADAAVRVAAHLAARAGAAAIVTWVLRPAFPMPPEGMPVAASEVEGLAGEPERRAIAQAAHAFEDAGGRAALARFELGRADERLLAVAQACDVDLVVVGARGRDTAVRRMLGGVSDRIASMSDRPLLVVK